MERRAEQVAAAGAARVFDWQGAETSRNVSTLDKTLRVTNHPLPLTAKETLAIDTFLTIIAAVFVMIPFCYLAGARLSLSLPLVHSQPASRSTQILLAVSLSRPASH